MKKRIPLVLPCHPCPHGSSCCDHGVELVGDEAERIAARWGEGTLTRGADGEPRTRVEAGKCVLFSGAGCSIHAEPELPVSCRGFPWHDGVDDTVPYAHDLEICPELTNDMDRSR